MPIRNAIPADADAIAEIYNHYIRTSHCTFELEPIEASEMRRRLVEYSNDQYPFIVYESEDMIGYAYGRPFRPRPGYKHAVEVAAYIRAGSESQGIGKDLYTALLPELFADGFHTIVATIALPNQASVRLHEKFGFEKVAHFREAGRKFDRWIDVGYWQLLHHTD